MTDETQAAALKKLREPFDPSQISKLPKPLKKDAPKGRCEECGGWHGLPAVHLDYVGHAALTHRLLDADPLWTWEPVGVGPNGLPAMDANGGMWIKLTVAGMTRLGYGNAPGKSGGDAVKEIIGDALRNAAMRFGAALDLWHKGDLHAVLDHAEEQPQERPRDQRQPDRQQSGTRAESDDERMARWVDGQVKAFEAYTAPADFDRLTAHRDDTEYQKLRGMVEKRDRKLFDQLTNAERAAFQRCDDVPF